MSLAVEATQNKNKSKVRVQQSNIQFKKRLSVHPASMFRIKKNLIRSPKMVKYSSAVVLSCLRLF